MSDTFGVQPSDVSAELPGLFPVGFTDATRPAAALMKTWIAAADTTAGFHTRDITAAATDAAQLAVEYIKAWCTAKTFRLVYAGNDPTQVKNAAGPYDDLAAQLLAQIDAMADKDRAKQAGDMQPDSEPTPRVFGASGSGRTRARVAEERF